MKLYDCFSRIYYFLLATTNPFDLANISPLINFVVLPEMLEKILDFTLSHPNFQSLLNENFDVVIVESFHSEVLMGNFLQQLFR